MTSLVLAAGMVAVGGTTAGAKMFDPKTFTLDNGMQVVLVENHRAPVVSHWVWYRVGSADSPLGKSGLAHFLEHLMFKGTDDIPPGEFSKIVARNGGNDNAMTSQDFTAYYQNIAKDRLGLVMEMEADRMTNLVVSPDQALSERDVILEERRSRVDNEPGSLLSEQVNAVQWQNHPYRLPIIGWQHEIASYTREDAFDFYRTWYAPNNAVLIVVGDVTLDELRPLAESTYGQIPPQELPPRVRIQEPPQRASREVTVTDPRVRQPSISRSYSAPSYSTAEGDRAYALEVLAEILGGGGTSRLYNALVVEQGVAAGTGAYYRGTGLDASTFYTYVSPRPGVDVDVALAALDAEIDRIVADGVDTAEVERVKKRLLAESVYARDSLGTAARIFGSALASGQTIDDVEAWPERIAAVTAEDVNEAARAVLREEAVVTGRLLPVAFAGEPTAG